MNLGLFFKILKYRGKFRRFFLEFDKDLTKFSIINDNIPDEVTDYYHLIKDKDEKKYSDDIQRYESFESLCFVHNKKVKEISQIVESFRREDFLKNPFEFSKERLELYYQTSKQLNDYKTIDKIHFSFIKTVHDYYCDYDKIIIQKRILDDFASFFSDIKILGYIDSNQSELLTQKYDRLKKELSLFQKKYYDYAKYIQDIDLKKFIQEHNNNYINSNINDELFDSINGKILDKEQRESVLTDETSTLVVAGAGSGKTLTICGKVEYLLHKGIDPNRILLLSYSKKSADDLQKKVSTINSGLFVGTFHKIGLDVLKETKNKTFMVEDQYKSIIEKYFRDEMKKRPHMLQTILSYYSLYISSDKHEKKYKNNGELFDDLKKLNFTTLKNQLLSLSNDKLRRETLKKETVKSFEEMAIANWYFINGIDYVYEYPYKYITETEEKRQYMPDFYLPKYNYYHEHYGINKEGKAEQFEGPEAQEYEKSIEWKRKTHSENKTICLETFSYEFDDGTVFDKLEQELKARGVEFHPLSDNQIFNALQSIYEGQEFKSFINLIRTFISLYKANYKNLDGFSQLQKYKFNNVYEKKRATLFLKIVQDVYLYYMNYIQQEGKIDFDDMILQSTLELDNTTEFKYDYIIVDEFQDISVSRMKFLKKLIEHGNSKLFAVGDDWQAIYRFSGCDLNIFLNFNEYFGKTEITKITTTHRNSQELQDIAGPFIRTNPEQFRKKINSTKHLQNPIQIMYYSDKKYYAFLDIVKEINKIDPQAHILILGRNNKDFDAISLGNRIYIDYKESNETKTVVKVADYSNMSFTFSTVHGSKGLEEDYVIIINADDSRLGFPNKMEDDELLDMVLSSKSNFEYAEERRLWYVALTRTRSYTYILVNNENPSVFVKEIESKCLIINPDKKVKHEGEINCPKCKSGRLVLRANENNRDKFYGCSNYPYCDYSINDFRAVNRNKRCKVCGDFMVYRKGQWGAFYGCHNYPLCKYTEEYTSDNK